MTNPNNKKVLIIAYYWPPAGGPGVQRWLKFVKYLPQFGVEPVIFVPDNPSYPIIDNSLLNEIPQNIKIIRYPITEIYNLASLISSQKSKNISKGIIPTNKKQSLVERLMLFIRGNVFIPDARVLWVRPSTKFLLKYITDHNIHTVVTTGPPHSLHLIGMNLKNKLAIKWIADFRDPWTTIGYHQKLKLTNRSKRKHNMLELKVLNTADQIIVTSSLTKEEFKSKTDSPIEVITNGYDIEDIAIPKKDTNFTIAHIGSMLSDRNPIVLWQVLAELINESVLFREKFKLKLIGTVGEEIVETIKKFGLAQQVEFIGYVDHKTAVSYQMSSRLLLLVEIDSIITTAILPGKLFEYIASGTAILAIGPKGSEIKEIIEETASGSYFTYDSAKELKKEIKKQFDDYCSNITTDKRKNIERYSRKNLTEVLAKLI